MKKQFLLYFATPYTDSDPAIVAQRVKQAYEITEDVIREVPGVVPFSPIGYTAQFGHMAGIDWLQRLDFRMLLACDASVFIRMPGWQSSEGMQAEKRFCEENSIPMFNVSPRDVISLCQQIVLLGLNVSI